MYRVSRSEAAVPGLGVGYPELCSSELMSLGPMVGVMYGGCRLGGRDPVMAIPTSGPCPAPGSVAWRDVIGE